MNHKQRKARLRAINIDQKKLAVIRAKALRRQIMSDTLWNDHLKEVDDYLEMRKGVVQTEVEMVW